MSSNINQLNSIRAEILALVEKYSNIKEQSSIFIPGETTIPPSGKSLSSLEYVKTVDAVLDGWLTTGRFNTQFEKELSAILNSKYSLTTNSGSSANLLAFAALTSPRLGERALKPGDEVITVAAGFPTTVNPIIQYGCVPVFVDVDLPTYNINVENLEAAITEKTKAIMLAHTLGNPFNLDEVLRLVKKYDLWLIEDSCDALGAKYKPQEGFIKSRNDIIVANQDRIVGTFGHLGTLSFYPAHHITMGEGGAVFTNSQKLKAIVESFRDWGRDCYCAPGEDNSCKKRFEWQLGDLPKGYDHKYIYSHVGYNLKITDMQAACGLAQLQKLEGFIQKRNENFNILFNLLKESEQHILLPKATDKATPSWFGFPITVNTKKFARAELIAHLGSLKIGTRNLFSGNIIRQPYMKSQKFRTADNLINTDRIVTDTFWIGVQPSLNNEQLEFVASTINQFVRRHI
ncbi:lipopolysaccharide biosynthesis protein RfbH [Pseudoalteromonas xiamenensis]|uniref:lipopolysaccharide biosynthesis protein RfbH n=1 Tax=Pseudoalteromonas xiamenensis TaxID=882626 RepID=UPI0035E933A5